MSEVCKPQSGIIYTRDEAMLFVEMFEDVLDTYNIKVPSPEDDEREPDNRGVDRWHSIKHDFGKEAKAWSVMILYLVMHTTDTNLSVKARTKKSSASVQRWSE